MFIFCSTLTNQDSKNAGFVKFLLTAGKGNDNLNPSNEPLI